jgi:hypothetical protein
MLSNMDGWIGFALGERLGVMVQVCQLAACSSSSIVVKPSARQQQNLSQHRLHSALRASVLNH